MIAYISGKIINFLDGKIIVKTNMGLGYLVYVSPTKRYMINENVDLYTLHLGRDDKEELYGFDRIEDRQWVENLMKVNGVGPKAAANIIYTLGVEKIKLALEDKDIEVFCNVKGLGKKTAQKIVLELKGAMVDLEKVVADADESKNGFASNFADAMTNLGYKKSEIVSTISVLKKNQDWNENNLMATIKSGLALLGK
jgi:holliday junction DNA helicase RuvA